MEPTYMETAAALGMYAQAYLTFTSLFTVDYKTLFQVNWYEIIKHQVNIMNDYHIDIEEAYNMLSRQNHLCKKCQATLTSDRHPTLCRKITQNRFLGMNTETRRFFWCCQDCSPNSSLKLSNPKLVVKQSRPLDNKKVERYISEEYDEKYESDDEDNAVYKYQHYK